MANDDRQSEQFIREVDEEFRRAQLKAIWDRFSVLIIGACVAVVVITAGYRGWIWWQARQAAEAGDRFTSAVQALGSADRADGEAQLAQIAEEGGDGYAALARLRLAGEKAAAGDKPAALTAYDALAADERVSGSLRDLARLRAGLLALDAGDLVGARQRAEPLDVAGSPWRHSAREVLGMAAYQSGELQRARDRFTEIQQDAETPPDLWVRSGMLVSLIDGQLAAPGSQQPAPATPLATTPPAAPVMNAPVPAEPASVGQPESVDAAPASPAAPPTPDAPPPTPQAATPEAPDTSAAPQAAGDAPSADAPEPASPQPQTLIPPQ